MEKAIIARAVIAHAKANYSVGGWDRIVECYDASEIEEMVADCASVEEAIAKVGKAVGIVNDVYLDRLAEAGS